MPLYLNAPLPGPFRYVKRIESKGTRGFTYWLLFGWWIEPVKWVLVGTWLLCRYVYRRASGDR